eukprot:m.78187 g.78187  ORF g.78187 m.78187 type:complete len:88 (-) comp14102_c0_seq2:86-349(-)
MMMLTKSQHHMARTVSKDFLAHHSLHLVDKGKSIVRLLVESASKGSRTPGAQQKSNCLAWTAWLLCFLIVVTQLIISSGRQRGEEDQ